ncbi:MAG: hypothetical protein GY725_09775 [bacterium]|nr:hypothetical protein [bacterium]
MKTINILLLVLTMGVLSVPATLATAAIVDSVEVEDGLVTGLLEVVNAASGTVMLGGVTYDVPSAVADLSAFSAGDDVLLSYVETDTGVRRALYLVLGEVG